ncbi:MAG TPA: dihydrofolate reductase family protein [Chitinophagales bacterium]|nr:dihydrofolate reductase family protein [Chitinophagales bacterium]
MRKLKLNVAVTLDGFIEGANGEIDWCFTDQDYGITDFLAGCDALVMGRKSFDIMLQFEPAPYPDKTIFVFSRSLKSRFSNVVVLEGNVAEHIAKLKSNSGKDIFLYGGTDLIEQCMQNGLVDEFALSVHPLLLGSGKPLFQNLKDRVNLTLVESITYDSGLVQVTYKTTTGKR